MCCNWKATPAPVPKRKKSLPGAADAPPTILSREEASVLSSQRREEVRRQAEEAERYRANPLLYFCSPQVKVTITPLIFHPRLFAYILLPLPPPLPPPRNEFVCFNLKRCAEYQRQKWA